MFSEGQQVVCINDSFDPWVFDLYRQLPKKGSVYTVRSVSPGRSNPKFEVNEDAEIKMKEAEFDVLILLNELINPDDPHSTVKQELGFRAERFAEQEVVSEEAEVFAREPAELVPA
jgi:hypothetical protein